jgi:predicted ArsR family transcriptional regulator
MVGQQLSIFDIPVDTRREAHEAAKSRAKTLRQKALEVLAGLELTADEIAERMGETPFSIRPRITELKSRGLILDTGLRRRNASGERAKVWRIK